MDQDERADGPAGEPAPARRLVDFDAIIIVMGGIIGAGIFVNPAIVARLVHPPAIDVLFFGLTGASLLIFRSRANAARAGGEKTPENIMRVPLHPVTT